MSILLTALTIIAAMGAYSFYTNELKKESAFFPVTYISAVVLIMYMSGLSGSLKTGQIIAYALGFICIAKRKDHILQDIKTMLTDPVIWIFIAGSIWSFVITRGVSPSHPDDFSHWFRICKAMNADGMLPRTPDISYVTYAPGTALWIYYFTRMTVFAPENCFWAQSVLNLACCLSLTGVVSKEKAKKIYILSLAFVCLMSALLCSANITTYALLVDGVLGLVSLSAAVMVLSGRFEPDKTDIISIVLVLSFLGLIKLSGLLLALFVAALYLLKSSYKKRFLVFSIMVILPVLLYAIYSVRASFIYPDISGSAQAASISRWSSIIEDKSLDLTGAVIGSVILNSIDLISGPSEVRAIWICFITIGALAFFCKDRKLWKLLAYLAVVYAVYQIMLTATYLFSMTPYEAIHLGEFDRYVGTVSIYFMGITGAVCIMKLSDLEGMKLTVSACVLYISVILLLVFNFGITYLLGFERYKSSYGFSPCIWNALEDASDANSDYTEDSYAVIMDDSLFEESGLYSYFQVADIVETYFRSNDIVWIPYSYIEENPDDSDRIMNKVDHVVILGDHKIDY